MPTIGPVVKSVVRSVVGSIGGSIGGSTPFNPADLMDSTSYWWDASDASTITKNGSDQVSALADKSGNSNTLTQSTDADKPLANITWNGLPALDCRPDLFMIPTTTPFGSGALEVFAVFWSSRTATTTNAFVLTNNGGSTSNRTVGSAKMQFGGTARAVTFYRTTLNHTLIQHTYIEASGATTQYLDVTGVLYSGSSTNSAAGTGKSAFATLTGTVPMNGLFGEMFVFNRVLSADDRANLITYLTEKWQALEPVTKYHVVLIAGQSNARGQYGPINLTTDATNPRIAQLSREVNRTTGVPIENDQGDIILAEHALDNRWRDTATPPTDGSVGFGIAYAKELLATLPSNEGVLLVPCAQGGTYCMTTPPISTDVTWAPSPGGGRSNAPYIDAVARMNRMLALGHELHSILWCQGENEAAQTTMAQATYAGYMDAVVDGLRGSITGASSIPFIAVQIGSFLDAGTYPNAANVNAAIADLPNREANTAYVSNVGYTSGGDNLHYDAASQRAIGAALWTAYNTI